MLNKHWGSIQSPLKGDSEWTNISLDQFKNYISTIDNLSELRYIFNVKKITTEQAKEGMKAFLKAKETDIIATMKLSVKTDLGIAMDATELTSNQIQKIVDTIVETK